MPIIRKCCIPCANSKRKCDKKPECSRCIDRDIECTYPLPKRPRRRRISSFGNDHGVVENGIPAVSSQPLPTLMTGSGLGNEVNANSTDIYFANRWESMETISSGFDLSLPELESFPYIPMGLPPTTTATLDSLPALPAQSTSSWNFEQLQDTAIVNPPRPRPWFLQTDTWALRHCSETVTQCSALLELEPFISGVEDMLRTWVQEGHNNFIHRQLYAQGMPPCLQDAFTTLATYESRTPAIKNTILQIAEDRAARLVSQQENPNNASDGSVGTGGVAQEIRIQLARVQALLVYESIRLFDGEIRVRASAEKQIPTMRRWVTTLRETTKRYGGDDLPLNIDSNINIDDDDHDDNTITNNAHITQTQQQRNPHETHPHKQDYTTQTHLWHAWLLAESVRRTHLIVDAVCNIYQTLTQGWAECGGAVMFTARAGLWDARSASAWCRLVHDVRVRMRGRNPLLLAHSLDPGALVDEGYAVGEFDAFARVYWGFILGRERMEWWVERSEGVGG